MTPARQKAARPSSSAFGLKARLLAVILALLPLAAAAQLYPDPDRSTINDFAQVLSAPQRTDLHRALAALRDETGIHLVVVTLTRQAPLAPDLSFEAFATGLFNRWGIGDAIRNDGILFLVMTEDRRVRIELGSGYSADWDAVAADIIDRDIVPLLADDRWADGLEAGVRAIGGRIARPASTGDEAPSDAWAYWLLAGLAGFVALLFGGTWAAFRYRKCPECGARGTLRSRSKTLRPATSTTTGEREVTVTCSACGYENVSLRGIQRRGLSSTGSSGSSGFGGGSSSGGGASGRF